jgi:hypothetical protein
MKYTRELLEGIVRESFSVAEVLRKLGLAEAGGTHAHIARRIREFGIDTSHFLGSRANCGSHHKGGKKSSWQEVLIRRSSGRRQKAHLLRRALIESGREYHCEAPGCSTKDQWLGRPITLHVDHLNGDWLDDRPQNLVFLCPNCHSQTPNYCGNKGFAELTSRAKWFRHYRRRRAQQERKNPA